MPVDPYIARGTPGVDITNTLAQIVALRQRDKALQVADERTRLEDRRYSDEQAEAKDKKQLEHLLAKTEWALRSGNPRLAILSDPNIDPKAHDQFFRMSDEEVTSHLQMQRAHIASQLGVLPPAEEKSDKPKVGNVNPGDYTPDSLAKFQKSNNLGDLVPKPDKPQQYAPPSPMFSEEYQDLPDGRRQQYTFDHRTGKKSNFREPFKPSSSDKPQTVRNEFGESELLEQDSSGNYVRRPIPQAGAEAAPAPKPKGNQPRGAKPSTTQGVKTKRPIVWNAENNRWEYQ